MASLGRQARGVALSAFFLLVGCGVKNPDDYRFDDEAAGGTAGARAAGGNGTSGGAARGGGGSGNAAGSGSTSGSGNTSGNGGGNPGGTGNASGSGNAGGNGGSGNPGGNGGSGDATSVGGVNAGGASGGSSGNANAGTGGVKLPAVAVLSIAPPSANLGKVTIGAQSAVASFEVSNQGDAESQALSATLSGTDASLFALSTMECVGKKLLPGARCALGVRFAPTAAGAKSATLTVAGANELKATLSAEGVTPSALAAQPTVVEFASVLLPSSTMGYSDASVTIKNSAGQTSGVLSSVLTGATDFSVQSDGCKGMTLAQNQSCSVGLRFTPTSRGLKNGTLEVSGAPGGLVPVSLSGRGLGAGTFSIAGATASFAQPVAAGSTGTETVTLSVSNTGDVAATPTIVLSNATQFGLVDNCSGKSVAAGGSCSLVLTLKPTSAGAKSTDVTVSPGTTNVKSTVSGTGREARVVNVTVSGSGKVTAAAGAEGNGINCPTDCSETYYQTTATAPDVTLTATYDSTVDVTWSGACAGSTTSCKLSASAATNAVTVTFTKKKVTLTVTRTSVVTGATGTVTGGGINCGSTCQVSVDAGSTVTLTAAPSGTGTYFGGWSGGGCVGGALSCTTQALSANTTVTAKFTPPNVVFVSSATYSVPELRAHDPMAANDGVRGADQYCKDLAAKGTGSNLAGRTWVSLLAHGSNINTRDWQTRVGTQHGWVRVDGKPFGDTPDSIDTNYVVYYPPSLDENGARIAGNTNYAVTGSGCGDWTLADSTGRRGAGRPSAGGSGWNSSFGIDCSAAQHIYCMSIDYAATVTAPAAVAGRKWFLSDGDFTPGAGKTLATADALCQGEATKAGYTGTFKALLASSAPASTAVSRMNLTGTAWVRPDGVPVVATASELSATQPVLLAAPQVTASKAYAGNVMVWTGATSPSANASAATSCAPSGANSWLGGSGFTGYGGQPYFADFWFFYSYSSSDCQYGGRLYCLEQ